MQSTATITKEELYKKKPEEITMLLYEALERNIKAAIEAINRHEFSVVNAKLKRANDIVERLGVGLNYEAGIIADQLHVLYEYLAEKLIVANMSKSTKHCEEALVIVNRVASSWQLAMVSVQDKTTIKPRKLGYDEQTDFSFNNEGYNKGFDIKN
jgi:flagellar protein FliS